MSRALLLLLLSLPLQAPAWAQDRMPDDEDAQARIYFQNGRYHFENGHYKEAISAWNRAYELSARPQLLYNIASAQERLGDWQEALDSLNAYRSFAAPEDWQALERRIVALERRIAENARETQATESSRPSPNTVASPRSRATKNPLGLSLTGGGVAGLSTAVFLGARARAAGVDASAGCGESSSGLLCSEDVSTTIRRQQRLALGADISTGLGLLAVTGGVVLLVRTGDSGASLSLAPTMNGLTLRGHF